MQDAKFAKLDGVLSTRVGYTGGSSPNPTYESVCSNDGHTEAVKIEFNSEQLPYDGLLKVQNAMALVNCSCSMMYLLATLQV